MNPLTRASQGMIFASPIALACLLLLPLPSPTRAFGIHSMGLLIGLLTLVRGLQRARQEPAARTMATLLAAFGGLSILYRLGLLQRLFAAGTGLAVHPLRDALLWILSLVLLLLTLIVLNRDSAITERPWARLLDGLIFSLAFYLLLWMGLVRPWLSASQIPVAFSISSQVLFALTAAGLGLALHGLFRQGWRRSPLGPLAAALALFAIVFPWSLAASFHQSYPLDHPARHLGILAVLGVLGAVETPLATTPEGPSGRWVGLLPYFPATLAYLGFFVDLLTPASRLDPAALAILGCISILVIGRQGITLLEMDELNATLEQKVEIRTRELAERESLITRTQGMNLMATLGAGMAHDLNNLLSGAAMQADLIQPQGTSDPRMTQDLEALQKTLARAGELTHRLMEVGRPMEPLRPLDLEAHLRGMAPMLRALVPRTYALSVELGTGPRLVSSCASQLDQIIVNLVVNARDALPPGGQIHVTLRDAPRGGPEEPRGVALTVADTGSGIPDEALGRIFEPFFSTKAPGLGTGLGLGSVKAVVAGLGGDIQLRTKAGEGTTFSIWLPLAQA